MARKLAASTLLKQAQTEIATLDKELRATKSNLNYAQDARAAAESEVEQIHAFFDAVPGSIPREPEGSYGKKNNAMTRLAAWLAVK